MRTDETISVLVSKNLTLAATATRRSRAAWRIIALLEAAALVVAFRAELLALIK